MQAAPVTADRSLDPPPFDRQQVAGSIGGPLRKGNLFGFGAVEYRNQDGAIQVGTRDTAARVIRRSFAPAPLDDLMGLARVDWRGSANDQVLFRYSAQNAKDVASSGGDRPIASAAQRQEATNKYYALLGTWTRVLSSQQREQPQRQPERLRQLDRLALDRPAIHLPEHGRRVVVPCAAEHRAAPLAVRRHLQLLARLARASRRWRGAARGCGLRAGRVPGRARGAGRRTSRPSTPTATAR